MSTSPSLIKHALLTLIGWQALLLPIGLFFVSTSPTSSLAITLLLLSMVSLPLAATSFFFLRHRAKRHAGPMSKAQRAHVKRQAAITTPAQLRDTLKNAGSALLRNLLWGALAAVILSLVVTWFAFPNQLEEAPRVYMYALFVVGIIIEFPIALGTLLGLTPEIAQSALEDRAVVRERRVLKNNSELSGGLEVSVPSSSGDLSLTQGVGGMEVVEAEVTLDFDVAEQEAEQPQTPHAKNRSR